MYRILIFLYNCFLIFIVQKMNSKMVKYRMVVLTEREKTDMTVGLNAVGCCWSAGGQEGDRKLM
jgi:hypothetical protein